MVRQSYYFGSVIAAAASQFVVNYFFSQTLAIEDYGRFSLLSAGMGIFVSLFMFGQATAITAVYFAEEKIICRNVKHEVIEALKIICISVVVFGILGVSVWYKWYEKELSLLIVLLALMAALSNTLQAFFISLINCMDRYRDYFFSTLSGGVALIGIAILIPSISGYLIAVTASAMVAIMAMSASLKLGLGVGVNTTTRVFGRKELILLGWVAIPGMFISSAMGFMDKYLLGQLLTLKDVAVYSMAALLSIGIGRVFISALLKSNAISLMRNLQNQDGTACNAILRKTEWLLCALCVIAVLAYYVLAKQVVVAVFGERFIDAVPIVLTLFVAVMVEGMMQFMAQVLVQKRKLYIAVINGAVLLLIAVVLNYLFIPTLLIKGAVLTFFVCNMVALIVVYFETRKLVQWIRFPRWLVLISTSIFIFHFLY